MDISKFYDCDWCKINTDDNDIQVDYKSKLIKFFIDSDIKQLNITLYNGGIITTKKCITIYFDNSYKYKVNITLDKYLEKYYI